MLNPVEDERPVYIEFQTRAVEDREASIEAGHYVAKDVVYVVVTPPGGNLVIEAVAEEWLRKKRTDNFYGHYKGAYDAFLEGREAPLEGTPIKDWPPISPAQAEMCLRAEIRTVEDLATCSDSALERIGMGARALQQKAQTWLTTADGSGKATEKLNKLERLVETLKDEMEQKDRTIESLRAQLNDQDPDVLAETSRKRTRKKAA